MTFLNVVAIESALIGLNAAYPTFTRLIRLPHETFEHRQSHALLIRGPSRFTCRPALIFVSGVHAREWGGPDVLVNLAADLLEAYSMAAGLGYGAKTFTAAEIKSIVDLTDVVVFPDINPDGRLYSMGGAPGSSQAMWRKNRNPASGGAKPGVDVNRNYDFLWDFPTKFSSSANPGTLASTDPSSDIFHGTAAFSEPETRNVRWLVDQFPRVRYFVDIHSYTGDVLWPWGDDENQTSDPTRSFQNVVWDGQRGLPGDVYTEYLPASRLAAQQSAANVLRDGINAVRGIGYVSKQAFWLLGNPYPTSGASTDWAFSREFVDPTKRKLNGLVIEFNKEQDFFPSWAEMVDIIADVDAGLVALCLHARPTRLQIILCWFWQWWWPVRDLVLTLWRRLFPHELWGPYGPWSRIAQFVRRVWDGVFGFLRGRGGRR